MEIEHERLEGDLEKFNKWMKNLSENGKVDDIDPLVVRGVLESCGADFEITESDRESLRDYRNSHKRRGLDAVWGKAKVDTFKTWAKEEYIPYIEKKAGREIRTLWDKAKQVNDDVKTSGMMQFLGEITAFAAGEMSMSKYRRLTEDRIKKGKEWQYGDREKEHIPSPHSSFPVDFPVKAMDRLRAVI